MNAKSRDTDNDGNNDRIYTFQPKDLKLTTTDTIACLKLETFQKIKMNGCDKVKVIKSSPN
jgi:hypothetical protein